MMATTTTTNGDIEVSSDDDSGPLFPTNSEAYRMGFISAISLTRKGFRSQLEHHDLWGLPTKLSAAKCWDEFHHHWVKALEHRRPSLVKTILRAFWPQIVMSVLLLVVSSAAQYTIPLLMPSIITWFTFNKSLPQWWIFIYATMIFASGIAGALFTFHSKFLAFKFAFQIRAVLMTLIYRKSLSITLGKNANAGSIVNMMSVDAQIMVDNLFMFMQGAIAPIQIIIITGLLSRYISFYALISACLFIIALPVTRYLTRRIKSLRMKNQAKSDTRLKFIKEFLTAIRIIKYYAWEVPFVKHIFQTREDHLASTRVSANNRILLTSILTSTPALGIGLTFMFYGIFNNVDVTKVFSALAFLNMLRMPFIFFPMFLTFQASYSAAFKRIGIFATKYELSSPFVLVGGSSSGARRRSKYIFKFEDACLSWETPTTIAEAKYSYLSRNQKLFEKKVDLIEDNDSNIVVWKKCTAGCIELRDGTKIQISISQEDLKQLERKTKSESQLLLILRRIGEEKERVLELLEDLRFPPGEDDVQLAMAIEAKKSELKLRPTSVCLENISLKIRTSKLTMIVGRVGSGKTTVAMSLLGEVIVTSGCINSYQDINSDNGVAYSSQEAWILNATIRDNILFGKEYDEDWYCHVVNACALAPDFEMFGASDLTEIGERGTNLSGGQKQRVSVARAMYSKRQLVVLDDPFSSVDAHVGEHMFHNVVMSMVREGRTVVLVTNQTHLLRWADHVVVLHDRKILEQGHLSELEYTKFQYPPSSGADKNVGDSDIITVGSNLTAPSVVFKTSAALDIINRDNGSSTKSEERAEGNISMAVYFAYLRHGGIKVALTILLAQILKVGFKVMSGIWLSWWADPKNPRHIGKVPYIGGYIGLVVGECLFYVIGSSIFVQFSIRATRRLHNTIVENISHATIQWFESTPIGRIISRLSKDIDSTDVQLPIMAEQSISLFFGLIGLFVSISIGTPFVLILFVIAFVALILLTVFYRRTSIQLQRIESLSRSPILSHMSESVEGASIIRAYNMTDSFKLSSMDKINNNTVDYLSMKFCSVWFSLSLDMIGTLFVFSSYIAMILVRKYLPDSVPLAYIIFAVANTGGISSAITSLSAATTELENKMNAVERLLQYETIPREQHVDEDSNDNDDNNWPTGGGIEFKDLSIKYPNGTIALDGVSCKIKPGEKIGIVGRTGAGKSTLVTGLFRMVDFSSGSIEIDGVDIASIGLSKLRSSMSIIPQTPQLFIGTIRYNLDPFSTYDDAEIWDVLEMSGLKEIVLGMQHGLDTMIEENGSNFSIGQKQLLSISRCLLKKTKILILDEATATVDSETDVHLQKMIRKKFKHMTVLSVAHRLHTLRDYDKIMVLDGGRIVEFETPQKLLRLENGIYARMVEASPPMEMDPIPLEHIEPPLGVGETRRILKGRKKKQDPSMIASSSSALSSNFGPPETSYTIVEHRKNKKKTKK